MKVIEHIKNSKSTAFSFEVLPPLKGKENTEVVCHCLNVTDKDIESAYKDGARDWEGLQERTKIGTVCGSCKERALELLHQFEHLYG